VVGTSRRSDARAVRVLPAGAASETLAEGVIHLDPEPAVFDAMLQGWAAQMASRGLKRTTMQSALWLVRRFAAYTNDYPWHWQPADVDEFCAWLSSGKQPRAVSTLRGYQIQLSMFCEYVCDPRYGWLAICQERFGSQPQQVCTEQNRAQHVDNYEGDPGRRPLTPEELQAFFDYADEEVERIRQHGRKGALAAFRDAALFKVVYGWGLRRREAIMLDLADLHPNPTADRFGRYGALHVRWGKAKRGGAPRRRTVLAVFDWAVEALQQYVEEVRPAFGFTEHSALWVTERGSRLSARAVDERFATYRQALQFPPMLDLHSLRHSYVTHLVEAGFPERFVTDQVGHSWGSTTAIYCSVSDDYKNRILAKAVAGAFRSSPDGNVS
jgi:site-specific recombinase XerD